MINRETLSAEPLRQEEYAVLELMLKFMAKTAEPEKDDVIVWHGRTKTETPGKKETAGDCRDDMIEESSFGTAHEYGDAVFDYINRSLRKHGYQTRAVTEKGEFRALIFETQMAGRRTSSKVLCSYGHYCYTVEITICESMPARTMLAEYLVKTKRIVLNRGFLTADKTEGNTRIIFTSSYRGSFSPTVFGRFFDELLLECSSLCRELPQ